MKFSIKSIAALSAAAGSLALMGMSETSKEYDQNADPWFKGGQAALAERLAQRPNTNRAKNVIVFIADGFGVTAATVSRIYAGQALDPKKGEENFLSYERFPYSALVKTYSTNGQVADSAATASAIMTGVKTNNDMVSVHSGTGLNDCASVLGGVPQTLGERASAAGLATGVITTTLITDATPSALYAHSPDRHWMIPSRMPDDAVALGCRSISDQLIDSGIDVAMGGGRKLFTAVNQEDVEDTKVDGERTDGRDLTTEWGESRTDSAYVWSREQLLSIDTSTTKSLLGLFAADDPLFEANDGTDGFSNPSLTEMTLTAIDILSNDPDGFLLLVEHEGTDEYQHGGYARKMAESAVELADAVAATLEKIDLNETLVIVTADHSQTLAFGGWPVKGNPVFGLTRGRKQHSDEVGLDKAKDGKPYTAVGFYAGPGGALGARTDLSNVDTEAPEYRQQALIPMGGVPHSGEDVPLYAIGPWAHLFGGLVEQNVIFHIIDHAAGLSAGSR